MPNSIFNGNPMYLPPVQYNFEDYTAPQPGVQASAGQTPYDRWLYAQNSRLGNLTLPSYTTSYAASNTDYPYGSTPAIPAVGSTTGSGSTNTATPWPPAAPTTSTAPVPPTAAVQDSGGMVTFPDGSQGYPAGYTGTVIGGGSIDSNGNYITSGPLSDADRQWASDRAAVQNLVASGDQIGVLQYLQDHSLDANFFNDALSYSGSPTGGRTAQNWLIDAAQNNGGAVTGLSYASPEEVKQFLDWLRTQDNVLTNQNIGESWSAAGITDPYDNQRLRDIAQEVIAREKALQNNRASYVPQYQTFRSPETQQAPLTVVQSNPQVIEASSAPTQPPVTTQAPQQPAYQQVAGQFVNQDTGDIVTYDSNGRHTSTGRTDPAWLEAHQPPRTQNQSQPSYDFTYNDRARGGLISLSQKYAAGGLASKYGVR
jgi:hypothetical protein